MPHRTYNEELLDATIRHQIGVQNFDAFLRNQVWALLDATEADLKRQITRATRAGFQSPARVTALNRLLAGLAKTRRSAWADVRDLLTTELTKFSVDEAAFFDRVFTNSLPGVVLDNVLPEPAVLRNIARSMPIHGKTMAQWTKNLEDTDISRITDAVRVGMIQGETPQQISRRIVGTVARAGKNGVTQITRNHALTIVRSITNGIGAGARAEYLELNKDIAPQKLFVATLDSRTSPICRGFDGQLFDTDDPKAPVFILHLGERSLYSPVVDGEVIGTRPIRNFTQRQLVREFGEANNIKVRVPRGETLTSGRNAIPRGFKGKYDTFARRRMRELTGTVPAKTTYADFLGRQTVENQNAIMGITKARLFRRGELPLSKFVAPDGSELSLSALAQQNSEAFLKAGLDPEDFI